MTGWHENRRSSHVRNPDENRGPAIGGAYLEDFEII
jgi:hypothetical protein